MNSLLAELQKRKVFRAVSAYAIACFVGLQLLDVVGDALGITAQHIRWTIVLMLLGLPLVAYFSWVLELSKRSVNTSRRTQWFGAGLALGALALFGVGSWWVTKPSVDQTEQPTFVTRDDGGVQKIAVLRLEDTSPGQDFNWLAAGVATELRRQIGMWDHFDVVPNALSREWSSIDAAAGSDLYIDGNVQGTSHQVIVHLEVIDAAAGTTLWSRKFNALAEEALALQSQLATAIARFFGQAAGGVYGPTAPNAYRPFLRYLEFRNLGDFEQEKYWLEQTLVMDPNWALGWASLPLSVDRHANLKHSSEMTEAIEAYLRRAEQTAEHPLEWLWARHYHEAYRKGEMDASLETLREINSYGGGYGAEWCARLMLSAGMFEEAARYFRWASDQNPFYVGNYESLAVALINTGRSRAAVPLAERVDDLQDGTQWVGLAGPGLAYPKGGENEKGEQLSQRYARAIQAEEYGAVSTRAIQLYAHALDFELALANGDAGTALQHADWMLQQERYIWAGTMLLRLEDSRAESALAKAQEGPFGAYIRFLWPFARMHLGVELQRHPWVIDVDNAFGFTQEIRHELCELANQLGPESGLYCDLEKYPDNTADSG